MVYLLSWSRHLRILGELARYSDAAKTYENFKDAVIAQYPDASTTRKYERHDLERVIGKYA